jgi:transcriptional regulator with XRE-family HTH domain
MNELETSVSLRPEKHRASAERMLRLRNTFGLTQAAFAKEFGFTTRQWSNYENGRPVGHTAAMQLIEKIPGLSLDWIYRGRIEGLSVAMAVALGERLPQTRPQK